MTDKPKLEVLHGEKEDDDGKVKHPKSQLCRFIAYLMDDKENQLRIGRPTLRFSCMPKMVSYGTGHVYAVVKEDHILELVSKDFVERKIIEWMCEYAAHIPEIRNLQIADASTVFRVWESLTTPVECDIFGEHYSDIPRGSARFAWNRPSWPRRNGVTLKEMPMISEILSRMSCPKEVCAWIGSIFDMNSQTSQYLWLYGEGGNGKSALVRLIGRICGNSYLVAPPPVKGLNGFWTHSLLGKRFVSFGDTNSYRFPSSDTFKTLTGDTFLPIEEKFGRAFNAHCPCKYVFTSNKQPVINDSLSDRRRIVYSDIGPITGKPDASYEERLWMEAEAFYNYCREMHETLPKLGYIEMPEDIVDGLVDPIVGRFEGLFDRCFAVGENESMTDSELEVVLNKARMAPQDKISFKVWLKKRYKRVRPSGEKRTRKWNGVGVKLGPDLETSPYSDEFSPTDKSDICW